MTQTKTQKPKEEKFDKFCKEFEKLMQKHGYKHLKAYEIDSNCYVTGPYFGISEDSQHDTIIVCFSLSGESGCPCCKRKENCNDSKEQSENDKNGTKRHD